MKNLESLKRFEFAPKLMLSGRVTRIAGLVIEADGPLVEVGSRCLVETKSGALIQADVVGFNDKRVILMSYGSSDGIAPGSAVISDNRPRTVSLSDDLLGRVLNGFGEPIDGKGAIVASKHMPIHKQAPDALTRRLIQTPITTGIKTIDGLLTTGIGQRLGIFAGSGVGKSVLLGMIARNTSASVNVVALIGERGREVKEFIERDLGEEGMSRSVIVVVTSDESALLRTQGVFVATTIAEYFRDKGLDVMLMMDSLTRFAMAQREIGLTVGEPPTSKGYPPSVFGLLPRLLERAGTTDGDGSITGLYTVLVEGDDLSDPIADTVRSILDGHIVLDRNIASKNQYPAINVLSSISRLMKEIVSDEHAKLAGKFKDLLSTYSEAESLINIGAYSKGSNPKIDESIAKISSLTDFLKQSTKERFTFDDTLKTLSMIIGKV